MRHKLLLADDSVTIQRVIELTFADEDVDVIAVGDGQLAIDRLESDPPDIVLADVDMPKRDGYEVAAYVKSRPKLAHIPVVLLTGAFEPVDEVRASRAGSSDVLAKPFEPQMVINRVKQLLGRKTEKQEPATVAAAQRPQASAVAVADDKPVAGPAAQSRPVAPGATRPAPPPPPARMEAVEEHPVSLDDYFDQLDAAFSNLQSGGHAPTDAGTMQAEQDWIDSQKSTSSGPGVQAFKPELPELKDFELPDLSVQEATSSVAAPAVPPTPVPTPIVTPQLLTAAQFEPIRRAMPKFVQPEPVPPLVPPASIVPAGEPPAPQLSSEPAASPEPVASPAQTASAAPPAVEVPKLEIPSPVAPPPARQTVNPFAELSAVKAEAAAARAAAPAAITEEVIEEVVSRVLQRLTDRVVRETVTEIVSQTAERLVQEEIQRIKAEGQ